MLSQQQIDEFHRDGFLILRGVFQGEELERLRKAADQVQEEGVAEQGKHHAYRDIDGVRTYFRSEMMWDRDDIFQAVTVNPSLLEAIGQCVGHPFLPMNDSFVCKIPGGNVPVEWHQDPPYLSSVEPRLETFEVPNFDVDIYLDDSTIENGCIWGIPGHHLVGHVDLEKYSQQELFEEHGAVPMEMAPGDVLFHCISAPHGSIGNTTQSTRRIFYVHYMAREVVEQVHPGIANKRGGFSPQGLRFVQGMLEKRSQLGLDGITHSDVEWTEKGFVFNGQPITPPRHWRSLIDAIPETRKQQLRRLQA